MGLDEIQQQTFAHATRATVAAYPVERRLTGDQIAAYLDRRTFAVVSTTRPDGRPHAVLSWFVRIDTTIWLPAVAGSVRERNVRHQPWVALAVAEGDHEHIVVLLEGPADALPPDKAPARAIEAVSGNWATTWLRVRVNHILSFAAEDAQV